MNKMIGMIALGAALTACAAPRADAPEAAKEISNAFDPTQASQTRLGPQNLQPGECGLFLWGQGAGRPLQLFQNGKTQQVSVPFKPGSKVTRLAAEQPVMDGLFERQEFMVDDIKMTVSINVAEGRNVLKGVAISGGRIELGEPSGRETIIPIVGLYGCRN